MLEIAAVYYIFYVDDSPVGLLTPIVFFHIKTFQKLFKVVQ